MNNKNSISFKNKTPPYRRGVLVLVTDKESLQIIQKNVTGKSYNQPAKKRRDSITQVADLSMPAGHFARKIPVSAALERPVILLPVSLKISLQD
jgi:hypothetical protein